MDRIAFSLGPLKIYWYSICIFLGMVCAGIIILKEAKRKNLDEDFLINLIFYTVLLGLLGARLYYVLFNIPYYFSHPAEILAVWNGGLAIHGGIIAGLIFIIFYCKKYKVSTLKILDIFVVGLIIGQAIGRWGNFFNGEAYGNITTLTALKAIHLPQFIINGMKIDGFYREPTFLYESLWCFLGFLILLLLRRRKNIQEGTLTSFYLIWYGLERVYVEGLRTDSLMLGRIRVAQLVSLIFIISGFVIYIYNLKKAKDKNLNSNKKLKKLKNEVK